jgi:hypothetical protein
MPLAQAERRLAITNRASQAPEIAQLVAAMLEAALQHASPLP